MSTSTSSASSSAVTRSSASFSIAAFAGQAPPDSGKGDTTKPGAPKTGAPAASSSGVMQLKKQISGDLSYRFLSKADQAGAATAAPVPMPAPVGGESIVALAVPSTATTKDSLLEVLDNGRGNVARLPVTTTGVANLSESSFNLAQRVNVPVQSKGLGVVGAQEGGCAARADEARDKNPYRNPSRGGMARHRRNMARCQDGRRGARSCAWGNRGPFRPSNGVWPPHLR